MTSSGDRDRFGSLVLSTILDGERMDDSTIFSSLVSRFGLDLMGCDEVSDICSLVTDTMRKVMDFDIGRFSWRPLDMDVDESISDFMEDDLPESFNFSARDNIVVNNDPLCFEGRIPESEGPVQLDCYSGSFRAKTPHGDPIVINLRSALSVPLKYKNEKIGQIMLFSSSEKDRENYSEDLLGPVWKVLGSSLGKVLEMESLRRERDRSRDLLDGTDDIIVVWRNRDSVWEIDCNRKAEEMMNMKEIMPDMMDGPFFVAPGKEYERAMNTWSSTFESGHSGQIDLQIPDRKGRARPFLCKFRAIRENDDKGPIIGVRMTGVEMDTLDSGVRQLESTNRTYRLLLSVISHDLKNPLAAVRGYSELMEYADEDKKVEYLSKITSLTKRMSDTISLAKTFAQLQEGKITSEFESIDLKMMVDNCLEMLYPKTETFDIIFEPGEGVFDIRGHRLLEQVALNLLDNAMKYSNQGTEIRVSLEADLSGIILSVSDRGKGVPDQFKTSIFERFSRVEDNSGIIGAGLGLAISKGICELHRGKIWVEDNPGGGSVFRVFLPWEP
jgi:signal transduction histidine kinase